VSRLKRPSEPLTPDEREVMALAYRDAHFPDPRPPTLAEACEVIRGLLPAATYGDGLWPAIARADAFLKRVEGK
jgi:hypothetical protein